MSSQPMPSQLRSDTARANGAKSQGPATSEGRARSSQNALRHGLSSTQVVIPGENPAEFEELRASYVELFNPHNRPELDLAHTMAAARWRLRRIQLIETELLSRDEEGIENAIANSFSPDGDFDATRLASNFDQMANSSKTPALLIRYERHLTRTYESARKELQVLQKMRVASTSRPELQNVRNEPRRQPLQASKPRLEPQNEPQPASSATPLAQVTPVLLRETPQVSAHTA